MENQKQTWEDWATEIFVGDNYYYYKNKWENQNPDRSFSSWNWMAFFFPYYWMAFRKMYLYAFIILIASLLSYIIPLGGIVIHIIAGIYANSWYYKKCTTAVKKASLYNNDEAIAFLKKQGGTSGLSLVISIVSIILLITILFTGFYAIYKYADNKSNSPVDLSLSTSEAPPIVKKVAYDVTTKGGEITYTVPEYYKQTEYENPDLFLYSSNKDITFISYVYSQEDFDDSIDEMYLIKEIAAKYSVEYKLEVVTDITLPVIDSYTSNIIYSNVDDGIISYYYFTCKKIGNYYVMTIALTSPSNWEKYQNEIVELISSARLT